jgi:hypothetical protein
MFQARIALRNQGSIIHAANNTLDQTIIKVIPQIRQNPL